MKHLRTSSISNAIKSIGLFSLVVVVVVAVHNMNNNNHLINGKLHKVKSGAKPAAINAT